jgi:adenylate cyclase
MPREIERKFRVKQDLWDATGLPSQHIVQGYLLMDPRGVLRVRLIDGRGIITIKMKIEGSSMSREEFEYEIPSREAEEMLKLCSRGLTKTRYGCVHEGNEWEVALAGRLPG